MARLILAGGRDIHAELIDPLTESQSVRLLCAARCSRVIRSAYFGQFSYSELNENYWSVVLKDEDE